MKDNNKIGISPKSHAVETQKKIKNMSQLVNPALDAYISLGSAVKDHYIEAHTRMQDMSKLANSALNFYNSLDIASINYVSEASNKIKDISQLVNPPLQAYTSLGISVRDHFIEAHTRMQDMSKLVNSALEFHNSLDIASKDYVSEAYNKIHNFTQLINPCLEASNSLGVAFKDYAIEAHNKIQILSQLGNPALGISNSLGIAFKGHAIEIQNKMQGLFTNIDSTISPFSKYIQTLPEEKVVINNDHTITCGHDKLHLNNLQEMISHILDEMGRLPGKNVLDYYTNNIIQEIKKLNKPFTEKIIIYFILPLLVAFLISFFNPIINELSNHYLIPNRQIVKYIKNKLAKSVIDTNLLKEYRIVTADKLIIRKSYRKDSKPTAIIYFGQTVKVIRKKRNWTFIEYHPNDESMINGWVFDRYLKKIN